MDLPHLRYAGKMLLPERDSYSYTPPRGVVQSNIGGQLSRLGRANIGGPAMVSCTLFLNDPAMLQWWDAFYNYSIAEGSKRFQMRLFVSGFIRDHVVQLIDTPQVTTAGWYGTVQLSLEAVPINDRCFNQSVLYFYECYGSSTSCMVNDIIETGLFIDGRW